MNMRMIVAGVGLVLTIVSVAAADITVDVHGNIQYQTILGWGAASGGEDIPQALRDQIHDIAVNDYGLTRLRLEPPGGNKADVRRWEAENDNGDPDVINWAAINTADWDKRIVDWVVPFKQRVEANGDVFSLYVSPSFFDGGSSGSAPTWLLNSPGENAEYALSLLLHLKDNYGIAADQYCILNEAGNNNAWTAAVVGRMIKALGPKLAGFGLPTKIQFPECVSADTTWSYIQALQNDGDIWPYIGLISYHLYGGNSARPNIYNFAKARNLPTAMTEYMGLTTQLLYDDLTLGGCSYWEVYGYQGRGSGIIGLNTDATQITSRGAEYWNLRQVFRYVRPGAVRVAATPSNAGLRTLAFSRNGQITVVMINNIAPVVASQNVVISGLPAGQYAASQVFGGNIYSELGVQTVTAGGTLTVPLSSNSVLTVYPYVGMNLPPTVTNWRSTPDYLTMPASTTTLTAAAADPELASLSYAWSTKNAPAGANVSLATPNAPSCQATGLTAAGAYTFTVAIGDGTNVVTKDVTIRVHAGNEPPVPVDIHNRIPVEVIAPADMTRLRASGYDLENDPLTYEWSIVSQPAGSNAVIASPTSASTVVVYLVPGDYVFRCAVKDPTHTVTQDLPIRVYPAGSAPVISSATPTPASARAGRTIELTAATSDPDGDTITHWWSVKTAPAGAKVVFAKAGSPNTTVSGLTIEGTYVFTLSVIDRNHVVNRDVTVTIGARLPADINFDGKVNVFDLQRMALSWNKQQGDAGYDPACDLTGDNKVDMFDLQVMANNWAAM